MCVRATKYEHIERHLPTTKTGKNEKCIVVVIVCIVEEMAIYIVCILVGKLK